MSQAFTDDQVRIVDFPATPVGLIEHRGDPALIGDTIRRFIAWRKEAGLSPNRSATFNILYEEPDAVAASDYRIDICAAVTEVAPNEHGVFAGLIPAGRCAVLRTIGSPDDLKPGVSYLYAEWLPRSGEEPRDFPLYAERVHFYPDVPESEAVTDIFLPLA